MQLVLMHHWRLMRFDKKDNGPAEEYGSNVMRAVRTFVVAALIATTGWTSSWAAEQVDLRIVNFPPAAGAQLGRFPQSVCPQLYKSDSDGKLVALEGEEIGTLLARSLQHGVVEKKPWYNPSRKLQSQPIISAGTEIDFDTVVVDAPALKSC